MAAVESGEVDGAEELQLSLANVSLDDDEEELLCRTLEYDLSMRLIVAHQIQTLKFDLKKRIKVYGSLLLCDLDGESDRMRRRVAAGWAAAGELDADDGADAEKVDGGSKDHDDDEETTVALREFRDMYIKASGVDDRYKEFDEMVWVHYDPDLDKETRRATAARLWRHIEKELDDRADAVTSGEFKYTYDPLPPRHQSQNPH